MRADSKRDDGAQSKRLIAVESLKADQQSKPKPLQLILDLPRAKCSAPVFGRHDVFDIVLIFCAVRTVVDPFSSIE